MIILNKNITNSAIATCTRNKTLTSNNVYYLWTIRHKLSDQQWKFIPYRVEPSVDYKPSYDKFIIGTYLNQPELYIGDNMNYVNLHLISGEYYLKIYEQVSSTNLDPSLSYDVVYEGMIDVPQDNKVEKTYTGNTDTYIVYKGS